MKYRALVDAEGGIVIPPEILQQLGWGEDTSLEVELDGKVGIIRRITEEEFSSPEPPN